MFNNPELKKNLRLEVNFTRLASCFGLLLLLFFAFYTSDTSLFNDKKLYQYHEKIFSIFSGVGFFFVIVWGTYLTASSIQEEVRQKTWDFVRMSSLSPAKILAGKLFGAPSLVWIVGVIGILPILMCAAAALIPETPYIRSSGLTLAILCGSLICWAILSHSLGMICSLHSLLQQRDREKFNTIGITLLILIAGFFVGAALISQFELFHDRYRLEQQTTNLSYRRTLWFGDYYHKLDLTFIMLAFSAFWAVMGSYRMLRQSLLFRDPPWAWILFLITTCVFLHGFTTEPELKKFLFWPALLCTITMGFTALIEAHDVVKYKIFVSHLQNGRMSEAFRHMPLWMISFTFLIITLLTGIIVINNEFVTIMSVTSLIAFVVRDLLVLHYLSWKPNIRRPLLACALYALVAYVLLPVILKPMTGNVSLMLFPLIPVKGIQNTGSDSWLLFYWIFQFASIFCAARLFKRRWDKAFKQSEPG
jgi:hypothetical protein